MTEVSNQEYCDVCDKKQKELGFYTFDKNKNPEHYYKLCKCKRRYRYYITYGLINSDSDMESTMSLKAFSFREACHTIIKQHKTSGVKIKLFYSFLHSYYKIYGEYLQRKVQSL